MARPLQPGWGGGARAASRASRSCCSSRRADRAAASVGLALLLAILNAGLFVESASGGMPLLSLARRAAVLAGAGRLVVQRRGAVGVLPSLLVLIGLTLVMLGGHAWAHVARAPATRRPTAAAAALPRPVSGAGRPAVPVLRRASTRMVAAAVAAVRRAGGDDAGDERRGARSSRTPALHAGGVVAAAVVVLVSAWTSPGDVGRSRRSSRPSVVAVYALVVDRCCARAATSHEPLRRRRPLRCFVAELTAIIATRAHAGGTAAARRHRSRRTCSTSPLHPGADRWQRRWPYVATGRRPAGVARG